MACMAREFVKKEWREVPAGYEDEAMRHPHLETCETTEGEQKGSEVELTQQVTEAAKPKARRKHA